jgi:transposase
MEVKVNIPEPEDINKSITAAIAQSAIGVKLREVIEAELAKLSNTYNNPIEKVVQDEIRKLLYQIIRDEYEEPIKEKIREILTEELLSEITFRALEAWTATRR